jgi:hypothetical protein
MSYWIYLRNTDGETVEVEPFEDGGTYAIGGTTQAEINVTYNYARHFDYRALHNHKAADTILALESIVKRLGTERDCDYWAPTPGNAGAACARLLAWAKQHPDAIWKVSGAPSLTKP